MTSTLTPTPTLSVPLALGASRFNSVTGPPLRVDYRLQKSGSVEIRVYNLMRQTIRRLMTGTQSAGYYTTYWDGKDDKVEATSSGLYFIALIQPGHTDIRKVVVIKQ
jgi:hypothetical protein